MSFKQHLTESVSSSKVRFLTHLEDLLIENGAEGATFALELLKQFGSMFEDGGVPEGVNLTVKWDGAPAVVFGPDPDDGEFFVATKSAFNKKPKLMKTHKAIDAEYGDKSVAPYLHLCLDYLKELRPPIILQGELIFVDNEVVERDINGKRFLTFKPNTIMYAVDKMSELGKRIAFAKLGIVLHTMYMGKGRDISAYSASPIRPTVFSSLKPSNDVVTVDATYDDVSGTATFTREEQDDFELALQRIESMIKGWNDTDSQDVLHFMSNKPMSALIKTFINVQVRKNSTKRGYLPLIEWLDEVCNSEYEQRSTPKGKQKVLDDYAVLVTFISNHKNAVNGWFQLHTAIANAKNLVIHKLGEVSKVQSFIPQEDGSFKVTGPEGFVATSHDGRMVKLVDRLEFSRANFAVHQD